MLFGVVLAAWRARERVWDCTRDLLLAGGAGVSAAILKELERETRCYYRVPRVRFVVRSRALWQAGRCASVGPPRVLTWLLRTAPLWVVVRVCELLRAR